MRALPPPLSGDSVSSPAVAAGFTFNVAFGRPRAPTSELCPWRWTQSSCHLWIERKE
jgi:hypothetical protein